MYVAVLKKDLRLLRNYWRGAAAAIIACYVVGVIGAVWLGKTVDHFPSNIASVILVALCIGSHLGVGAGLIFSVSIAGSVFTLERGDRSAEFLACLPPTRINHLTSKLGIVFGAALLMMGINWLAIAIADMLAPYAPATEIIDAYRVSSTGLMGMLAFQLNMIGAALAISAWMQSNGVPILAGLLAPIVSMSFIRLMHYGFNIPADGISIGIVAASLGILMAFLGSYWFVQRIDP